MAVRSYTFQRANTDVAQLESELIAAGIPIVRVSVDGQTCKVEVDVCQETHQDFLNLRWARMREKVVAHTPGVPQIGVGPHSHSMTDVIGLNAALETNQITIIDGGLL